MDVASVAKVNARSAQSHAQVVDVGRSKAQQAISEVGQREFERSQTSVGNKGRVVDVLA